MAAITLAPPGAEAGPCLDEGRAHRYRELPPKRAAAGRSPCEEPIGCDRRHHVATAAGDGHCDSGEAHATCFEDVIKEETERRRCSWS